MFCPLPQSFRSNVASRCVTRANLENDVKVRVKLTILCDGDVALFVFGATVASAPPPRLLELQDGVEAGPEPQPRRSTKTDSKYLHKEIVQNLKNEVTI